MNEILDKKENSTNKKEENRVEIDERTILRTANVERNGELEKMRNEFGEIGGAGHFWGNDTWIGYGGVRNWMGEKELKKVLQLLSLGEKRINLKEREFRAFLNEKKRRETQKKIGWSDNWEVAEAGWTIQFKSALKHLGGDGKYFYLWISKKGKN